MTNIHDQFMNKVIIIIIINCVLTHNDLIMVIDEIKNDKLFFFKSKFKRDSIILEFAKQRSKR